MQGGLQGARPHLGDGMVGRIVMAIMGAVVGVAIGGGLSRVGRRRPAMNASPMADSPEATEDRVSNYWLDHGRLTAAPGLPDPDETDQISLKP